MAVLDLRPRFRLAGRAGRVAFRFALRLALRPDFFFAVFLPAFLATFFSAFRGAFLDFRAEVDARFFAIVHPRD